MKAVISPDQARDPVPGSAPSVRSTWPGYPSLRRWVRMRVEFADNHGPGDQSWLIKVNGTPVTARRPVYCYIARDDIHVNPATFFVAPCGIIRLRIHPGLLQLRTS